MPRKRLTEAAVAKIKPTPGKQIDYFDTGLTGLMLRISYGGTKAWRALYYVGGKPKTHSLGRYPILKLAEARDKARKFLADPKKALADNIGTFKQVSDDFIKRHVEKEGLRTRDEIERCLD